VALDNARAIQAPDHFYTWTLRLLVERPSWFGERHQAQTVMHFAQVKGPPPRLIADYLSGMQREATNIKWGHLMVPTKVDTPHNQTMLRIAAPQRESRLLRPPLRDLGEALGEGVRRYARSLASIPSHAVDGHSGHEVTLHIGSARL